MAPDAPAVTSVWGTNESCVNHDSGPIAIRKRPSDTFRNARTMAASNWVPAHRASSARAATGEIGSLYERADVITSNASVTATIRAGQADVGAGDPPRVAHPVPALVVLPDGPGGVAEPADERRHELAPELGVLLDGLELGVGQLARLVEDLGGHEQLADVVQQCRPSEVVELGAGDLELLADHVGVGADALRVARG